MLEIREQARRARRRYEQAAWRADQAGALRGFDRPVLWMWLASVALVASALPALMGPVGTVATGLGTVLALAVMAPMGRLLGRLLGAPGPEALEGLRARAEHLEALAAVLPPEHQGASIKGEGLVVEVSGGRLECRPVGPRAEFSLQTTDAGLLERARARLEQARLRGAPWAPSGAEVAPGVLRWSASCAGGRDDAGPLAALVAGPTGAAPGWLEAALAEAVGIVDPKLDPLESSSARRALRAQASARPRGMEVSMSALLHGTAWSALACAWAGLVIAHIGYLRLPWVALGGGGDEFTAMVLAGMTLVLGVLGLGAWGHRGALAAGLRDAPRSQEAPEVVVLDAEGVTLKPGPGAVRLSWSDTLQVQLDRSEAGPDGLVVVTATLRGGARQGALRAGLPEALVPPRAQRLDNPSEAASVSAAGLLEVLSHLSRAGVNPF